MDLNNLGPKTILIVEDDAFNIQLLQTLLGNMSNFNIISSRDGAEALDILTSSETKVDMILLDIRMPIMTGKEFLEKIKANSAFADIPVLVISVDQSNETELRNLGATDFIHKPFDINDLKNKIFIAFSK